MLYLRTIIMDGDVDDLNGMQKFLQFTCRDIKIIHRCQNLESLADKCKQLAPDLVFLTISNHVKEALKALREIRKLDIEVIPVCSHDNFFADVFHLGSVNFLIKPLTKRNVLDIIANANRKIAESRDQRHTSHSDVMQKNSLHNRKLCLTSLKGFLVVDLKDILYCEASANYTNFYFNDERSVCTSKLLHEYEHLLADAGFIRIHKSFLINLLHVKEYFRGCGGTVILSNGKELEVARRKKDLFLDKMKEVFRY